MAPIRSGTRWFNALAAAGSAGHNAFERWAGVGVFLEPWLGRRATNAVWSISLPAWMWRAVRPQPRDAPALAFGAGVAVAGFLVHYVEWPWSVRLGFVPWLEEAEGLPPEQLTAYNLILLAWFVGGAGSIISETERQDLKWVAAGLATMPVLLASARHHFAWARRQAQVEPDRWNPALRGVSPSARMREQEARERSASP